MPSQDMLDMLALVDEKNQLVANATPMAVAQGDASRADKQEQLSSQFDSLLARFQEGFVSTGDIDADNAYIRNSVTGFVEKVGHTEPNLIPTTDVGSFTLGDFVGTYGYNAEAFRPISEWDPTDTTPKVNAENVTAAYQFLNDKIAEGSSLDAALSDWYGTDIVIPEAVASTDKHLFGAADGQAFGEFQAIAKGILNVTVPFAMTTAGPTANSDWVYNNDPMLRAVYESYGINPYRSTDDGSTYTYDPLIGTVRTRDAGDDSWVKPLATTIMAGVFTAMGGAAGTDLIGGAVGQGAGAAAVSGTTTALQGGDAGDILTSAILSGAAGYASGLNAEAASAGDLAIEAVEAGASNAASLTASAELLADHAALADTISNSAYALNSIANEDYLSALSYGLDAAGLASPQEWATGQFASLVDPTGSGLVAGVFDTQPLASAAWRFSTQLADGRDSQGALLSALRTYVEEGGTLNTGGALNLDLPDTTFLAQFDSDMLSSLEDAIRQAGSFIDDTVIQPIADLGSLIDDAVLQPVREGVEQLVDAIPSVDLPSLPDLPEAPELDFSEASIDLPDFNLEGPEVDLPSVDVPSLDLDLTAAITSTVADILPTAPGAANSGLVVQDTKTEYQGRSDLLAAMLETDPIADLGDAINGTA